LDACGRIAADQRCAEEHGGQHRNLRGCAHHVITASMPHHHGLCTAVVGTLVGAVCLGAGCDKDKLNGPEAEVHKTEVKLNLPPVPAFDLPPAPTDGSHTVKELRVKGKKLLESEITVKGIVTWAYDCPTAVRQPGMSDKDLQKMIDDD